MFFDALSPEVGALSIPPSRSQPLGMKTADVSIPMLDETEEAGNQIAWAEATLFHQQQGYFPARSADMATMCARAGDGAKYPLWTSCKRWNSETIRSTLHLAIAEAESMQSSSTTPIEAPLLNTETSRIGANDYRPCPPVASDPPANLAGTPSLTVPCGFTRAGLPIGLQIMEECRSRAHAPHREHLRAGSSSIAGRPCSAGILPAVSCDTCTRFWPTPHGNRSLLPHHPHANDTPAFRQYSSEHIPPNSGFVTIHRRTHMHTKRSRRLCLHVPNRRHAPATMLRGERRSLHSPELLDQLTSRETVAHEPARATFPPC